MPALTQGFMEQVSFQRHVCSGVVVEDIRAVVIFRQQTSSLHHRDFIWLL